MFLNAAHFSPAWFVLKARSAKDGDTAVHYYNIMICVDITNVTMHCTRLTRLSFK